MQKGGDNSCSRARKFISAPGRKRRLIFRGYPACAAGALAHAEDVLDLLGFEGCDGVGADHAAIGDNARLADPEALPLWSWCRSRPTANETLSYAAPTVLTYWVWGPSGGAFDYLFADWRSPSGGWGNP